MSSVNVEIEKNKFVNMDYSQAIEIAVNEYFKGNIVKLNGKDFDVMSYGNYKDKLLMEE